MSEVFSLGVPGPSGNENDTFVAEKVVYKVNNLFNSGSIVGLLRKILMHNIIFPDTSYSFHAFAGFDGRIVQPVIAQPRVANAQPATQIMIDTYMAALGFEKTAIEGRFSNGTYEVWDLVPRNVLVDRILCLVMFWWTTRAISMWLMPKLDKFNNPQLITLHLLHLTC